MSEIVTIGLDIAKSVFQVHGVDAAGQVVVTRQLKRGQMLKFFAALPPVLIGIEACGTAHHWGRQLQNLGHDVKLIPPIYVKPYVRLWRGDHKRTNHQVTIMRRNAGQTHGTRPVALLFANFAAHYFPANLCSLLTSRGVIDVEI